MSVIRKIPNIKIDRGTIGVNIQSYNNAQEVVNDCRTNKVHQYEGKDTDTCMSESWDGVNSYEEALDYLANGYQPTVDELAVALRTNKGNSKRIKFENNIYGFAPIVPLALKGVPQSMINMTMKPIKCKVLDVYYDVAVNGNIKSKEIIEAGQKLLGTIIDMEKQGHRFNLYAMQSYNNEKGSDILVIKVKDANRAIDLKRISFPLTHPAYFRVIGFDWQAKSPVTEYRGCGRGRSMNTQFSKNEAKQIIKQCFGDNAIYMSCTNIVDKKYESEEHLNEYLKGELEDDGIKIKTQR